MPANNNFLPKGTFQIIEGTLSKDAELGTARDQPFAKLSIPVKYGAVQDANGTWQDKTQWYNLSIFNDGTGASAKLITAVENGDYVKGAKVRLYGFFAEEINEYKGKHSINYKVVELLGSFILYAPKREEAPTENMADIFAEVVPGTVAIPDDWE